MTYTVAASFTDSMLTNTAQILQYCSQIGDFAPSVCSSENQEVVPKQALVLKLSLLLSAPFLFSSRRTVNYSYTSTTSSSTTKLKQATCILPVCPKVALSCSS